MSYKLGSTRAVAFKDWNTPDWLSLLLNRFDHNKCERAELTWIPYSPDEFVVATARIDSTEAQRLMDSLWDCGVRPTSGAGSAGAMAAVQSHLQDMRTLVFKLKPQEKKQ